MNQAGLEYIKQSDFEDLQMKLKLANERAQQLETWEQVALANLSKANIKNAELQAEHHHTYTRLVQCLNELEAIRADVLTTTQARDRDIFWRLANPLRKFVGYFPRPIVVYSRKSLKLVYWLVTPWKMKTRFQFIKNRNELLMQQSTANMQNNKQTMISDQNIQIENIVLNMSANDLYERMKALMNEPLKS